jgi:hypothetical protein
MLSPADRALVEGEALDPDATIAYNEITACLVWSDEVPDGLSRTGYEFVRDLLAARGFIHRGVAIEDWDFGWTERVELWNGALADGLRWNGFQRIALTKRQRELLQMYLAGSEIP